MVATMQLLLALGLGPTAVVADLALTGAALAGGGLVLRRHRRQRARARAAVAEAEAVLASGRLPVP